VTANHARANDVAALRRLVEPVRLKRHDALKILAHDDETQTLLVDAITTYQGVTSYTSALQVIKAEPRYKVLCETCGWSLAMICPECPRGCGCETDCTGWRHRDYGGDSFDEEYEEDADYDDDLDDEYIDLDDGPMGDDEALDQFDDEDYEKYPLGPPQEEADWGDDPEPAMTGSDEGGPYSSEPPF
jgi:hypothetical protein